MTRSGVLTDGALPGALAGLAGGLVFGAAMVPLGMLPTIASLVRASTAEVGFLVHMVVAAIVGAGFGVLVWRQRLGAGEMLFWGLTYGTLWWFLGPLTLSPLLRGGAVAWDVASAQRAFPSLLGHLWYGAATAIAFVGVRRRSIAGLRAIDAPTILRGTLAGLAGAWLLRRLLDTQAQWLESSGIVNVLTHRADGPAMGTIGLLAGVGFALFYPRSSGSAGPALVRGSMFGFFLWVAVVLTVMPLVSGEGLAWSLDAVRARFPALPGFLLFGAFVALVYRWLEALTRLLLSDDVRARDEEGVGVRGLRAVARGAFAGLIGGFVFTVVMVRIGVLPAVARLIGSDSALHGFIVHLVIANLIGISFGLLFLRQSYDVGSALGWGLSYGFFWWILGPLTLMPVLLGAPPRWTVEVAGALFPSLVGHLAYGASLGVTFHLLEARYNPWWISHNEIDAARAETRRELVLTSAPALWALLVVIALTMSVVLTCGTQPITEGGYSMTPRGPGYGGYFGPSPSPYGSGASRNYGVPARPAGPLGYGTYAPAESSPRPNQPGEERETCFHG